MEREVGHLGRWSKARWRRRLHHFGLALLFFVFVASILSGTWMLYS